MKSKSLCIGLLLMVAALVDFTLFAQTPPVLTPVTTNTGQANLKFEPYPSAQAYTFLGTTNLTIPGAPYTNFNLLPYNLATNKAVFGTNAVTNIAASYAWRLS